MVGCNDFYFGLQRYNFTEFETPYFYYSNYIIRYSVCGFKGDILKSPPKHL